jgi:hypothetical protein
MSNGRSVATIRATTNIGNLRMVLSDVEFVVMHGDYLGAGLHPTAQSTS